MLKNKDLLLPMLFLTLLIVFISFIKPFLIIDETRYIGVAWEMYLDGNYFVPHLNGVPYDHKPPLLFWLINLDWQLFGLNSFSLRFIPLLFALGILILNYKIYKLLWPSDERGASYIAWVSVSLIVFSFYTTLFMFDIMLSFWVVLAIYGGLKAIKNKKLLSYFIIALAIGFGILAKSPVVIAHLLPLYLFAFYWAREQVTIKFYLLGFVAVLVGIAIALIWAIPAAKEGGEAFARGIFWEQYAGRAVDAFAHKRPFWWYLPWIFLILYPWTLYKGFWSGLKVFRVYFDNGMRFLLVWIVGALLIFSFISGKQLHYIAPEFAAFALLVTRALSLYRASFYSFKFLGVVLAFFALSFFIAPFFIKGYLTEFLDIKAFLISATILALFAFIFLRKKFLEQKRLIQLVALSSLAFIASIYYIAHIFLAKQDLTEFSKAIAKVQNSGYEVAHIGKYHNQYQYFGRLQKPIKVLWSKKSIENFIKNNPNGAIITYKKRKEFFNKEVPLAVTKFRTQNALLVPARKLRSLEKK
jgi:4-amino-4-deoxy-L-arabinose transferase-like glycosyltransferase